MGDGRRKLEACVSGYGGDEAVRFLQEGREFDVLIFDFVKKRITVLGKKLEHRT